MRPGMASGLLRELAPLLAEEGIDVDNIDLPGSPPRRWHRGCTFPAPLSMAGVSWTISRWTPGTTRPAISPVSCSPVTDHNAC